ncbi:MAG TPA: hypothetical protein VFG10_09870 [Saprospiraceae bacterium]|nr:hypothetical protein [Saprospiraceae bacterium]
MENEFVKTTTHPEKPPIKIFFKYMRGELSPSEMEEVDNYVKSHPEYVDILEGIRYAIKKYGKNAERVQLRASLSLLPNLMALRKRLFAKPNYEVIQTGPSKKKSLFGFEVTPALVFGSGGIAIAMYIPLSKNIIDNNSYLLIVQWYFIIFSNVFFSKIYSINLRVLKSLQHIKRIALDAVILLIHCRDYLVTSCLDLSNHIQSKSLRLNAIKIKIPHRTG